MTIPAKIKVYSLRLSGPSTGGEDVSVEVHGLGLNSVISALLMLEIGDRAEVVCTAEGIVEAAAAEETAEGGTV